MQDKFDAIVCILTDKLIAIEDEYTEKYPHADEIIPDLISDILIAFETIKPEDVRRLIEQKKKFNDDFEKFMDDKWDTWNDNVKVKS